MKNTLMTLIMGAVTVAAAPAAISAQAYPEAKYDAYPVAQDFDLELQVAPDKSSAHFQLWSPQAQAVRLNLYDNGHTGSPYATIDMTRGPQGTWVATVVPAPMGKFYTFQVLPKDSDKWLAETPGITPQAVGVNGLRAAIIDMEATNPEGWDQDKGPVLKSPTDAVVYEMHHRDFSIHPSSGVANKGKFLALTEPGTTSPQGLATGIDHLKELGVTHVHILPSYDFNSVDETQLQANGYNWGYDPLNYNALEGSYSTNPSNPSTRITEFKEMVKALHDAGIGVIMDVVYNHTATNDDSNFSLTAPGYFYRHRADGSYSDASGCGNETASDRQMMQNFIVNSVKHWAKDYHVDGFRFDLMAIHDTATMSRVGRELHAINPSAVIYGEGWTCSTTPLPADQQALKVNVADIDGGVAVFSDDIRDGVKGHYSEAAGRGFATGAPDLEETVKIGIVGATDHPQVNYAKGSNATKPYAETPAQVVNYVSCHDDMMLTDKLRASMPEATEAERQRAARLAQTIVMTSQGMPFMFAGEELFRDKKGVHNSYKSPDSINAIDWTLKALNADQMRYYKELIALRKSHPAFRMSSAEDVARHLRFDNTKGEPGLVSYSLLDNANGDEWQEIKVVFNGADADKSVRLPKGEWILVAYDGEIDHQGLRDATGAVRKLKGSSEVTVPHRSALILAK